MGTKNTLIDLNDHLFEQLERLNDDSLTDEQLEKEIKRADAMSKVAKNITDNANIVLRATEINVAYGERGSVTPRLLSGDLKV